MDVENAKIISIGEISKTKSGHDIMNIVVQHPTEGKKTYVIFENKNHSFDEVRRFRRGYYQVGQTIDFNFNKAVESWQYDSIWKLKVREQPKPKNE